MLQFVSQILDELNLFKLGYGGLILSWIQFVPLPTPAGSENTTYLLQKWFENNHSLRLSKSVAHSVKYWLILILFNLYLSVLENFNDVILFHRLIVFVSFFRHHHPVNLNRKHIIHRFGDWILIFPTINKIMHILICWVLTSLSSLSRFYTIMLRYRRHRIINPSILRIWGIHGFDYLHVNKLLKTVIAIGRMYF